MSDAYSRKPNIDELEAILSYEDKYEVVIMSNGEVRSTSDEMLDKIVAEFKNRPIIKTDADIIKEQQSKIATLTKALEFYAGLTDKQILGDCGRTARTAIEETKGE